MISGTLFAAGALWCATLYLSERGIQWLWFSGLLADVGILYRHDLLLCICVAVRIAVFYQAIAERRTRSLKAPGIFVVGVFLLVEPPLWMLRAAVPHNLLRQVFFEFPRTNAAARHLPLPGPRSRRWATSICPS
jgi:hypothetical protein